MKWMIVTSLVLVFVLLAGAWFWWTTARVTADHLGHYRIYYGEITDKILDKMKAFDLLVVEPKQISQDQVQELKKAGVKVVGYLSVMEVGSWDEDHMEVTQPYWLMEGSKPLRNGTNPVGDLTHPLYQGILLEKLQVEILNKGMEGVFLDTVETSDLIKDPQVYTEIVTAYSDFLGDIRRLMPEGLIIQNRGFDVLASIDRFAIDAFVWENFFLPEDQAGEKRIFDKRVWDLEVSSRWRSHAVLTISYEESEATREFTRKRGWGLLVHPDGTSHNRWVDQP